MRIEIRPLLRGKPAFTVSRLNLISLLSVQICFFLLKVDIDPSKTISDLKLRISTEEGYPVETQNIVLSGTIPSPATLNSCCSHKQTFRHQGRSLQDDKTIDTYNIQPKKYLVLIVRFDITLDLGIDSPHSPVAQIWPYGY
jgi:Ubiquitin family